MKQILIFGLLTLTFCARGQVTTERNKLRTSKYAGTYSFGTDIEKERIGTILIYPETDSTILFYIDLNRGAPSYNMSSLYERLKVVNGEGTFHTKFDFADKGCTWTFKFLKNNLIIKTVQGQDECGFGAHVFADGEFKLSSNKTLDYFKNMEGRKVYFKTTKPDDYYK